MEKKIRVNINKNTIIHGVLNGSLRKPLVIFVHGLPGNIREAFYERAALWFEKQGYASFRFNLYDWQKGARQLVETTLKTHAADLDAATRYFRKKGVKRIFVAGHSYGGPSILLSQEQDFDAAVLWDPSYDLSFSKKKHGFPGGTYVKQLNGWFMGNWGVNVILGHKMVEEADRLPWKNLTKFFHVPLKILSAGKGLLVRGAQQYFKNANEPKKLVIIKGATHYFNDHEGTEETVFSETKKWFDLYQ